jgi:hypothetical protein
MFQQIVPKIHFRSEKMNFQAALYTGGLAGGISALGWVAPSKDSFNMMAPLAMGMGLVLVAAMASPFFRYEKITYSGKGLGA